MTIIGKRFIIFSGEQFPTRGKPIQVGVHPEGGGVGPIQVGVYPEGGGVTHPSPWKKGKGREADKIYNNIKSI